MNRYNVFERKRETKRQTGHIYIYMLLDIT
jgi:hypothetical protein